jgi:hypothetical protein
VTADRRQKRIAKNETSFRDINERLEEGLRRVPHAPEHERFICECGSRECESSVLLSLAEYEAVRGDSRRFFVVPGHVYPEVERVVSVNDRYEVIEKIGDSVEVTDAADQRSRGAGGRRSDTTTP